MKYGPDLPQDKRLLSRAGRLLQTIGLGFAATFLFSVALSLYLVFPLASLSPVELYHNAWEQARAHVYDEATLKDWDKWEHKYDGQIKTQEDAVKYINEMLKSTGDHYAVYLDAKDTRAERDQMRGEFAGIGIEVQPRVDDAGELVFGADKNKGPLMLSDKDGYPVLKVIEGGPSHKAGIKDGDVVLSINGTTAKDISTEDFVSKARGKVGTEVLLRVRNDQGERNITIVRGMVQTKAVSSKVLTSANGTKVGYIRLDSFIQSDTASEMHNALASLGSVDKVILDLRYNPGGDVRVCVELMSMFIEKGILVSTRERDPGAGHVKQTFSVDGNEIILTREVEGSNRVEKAKMERPPHLGTSKKVVILVNGKSASAAEMFTGALKDNGRAVVVGERTFGKGIGQVVMPMPNGTTMHITSLRYFTPNGTWLGDGGNGNEKFGVEPHHEVELKTTPKPRLGDPGRDSQLQYALELLSQ
jgi:carboxyl-terminal processing protease